MVGMEGLVSNHDIRGKLLNGVLVGLQFQRDHREASLQWAGVSLDAWEAAGASYREVIRPLSMPPDYRALGLSAQPVHHHHSLCVMCF